MTTDTRAFTPPEVAEILGVNADKIRQFIQTGQLKAVNMTLTGRGQRPRYRILPDDLRAFIDARSTKAPAPKPQRRRQMVTTGKEYF